MKQLLTETTTWEDGINLRNHSYIVEGMHCYGYIQQGKPLTRDNISFFNHRKTFDKKNRKFITVKNICFSLEN